MGQGLVETIFYPLRLLSGSFFNCCSGGKVGSLDKFWADLGRYGPTKCLCSPSHFLLSVLVAALAWLSLEKAGPGSLTCCLVLAFLVLSSCALSGLGTLPPLGTVKQIFEKISCPLHLTVIHRPSPWLGGRRIGYLDKAEPKPFFNSMPAYASLLLSCKYLSAVAALENCVLQGRFGQLWSTAAFSLHFSSCLRVLV